MSNLRRTRVELSQGLHQFLMSIYQSYRSSTSSEDALGLIKDKLQEEYVFFAKESMPKDDTLYDELYLFSTKMNEVIQDETDSNEQYKMHAELESIIDALAVIKKYNDKI